MKKITILLTTALLFSIIINSHAQQSNTLCQPTYTSSYSNYGIFIYSVTSTGGQTNISNTTGSSASQYPSNDYRSQILEAFPGDALTVSVEPYGSNPQDVGLYIDLNNDGNYATSELYASAFNVKYSTGGTTLTFDAPNAAGDYNMRIISGYSTATSTYNFVDGCTMNNTTLGGLGEAEDYTISVSEPPSCGAPTSLTATPTSFQVGTASFSWSAGISNDSYSWEIFTGTDTSATAVDSGTTTSTTDSTNATLANNQLYTLVLTASCSGTPVTAVSTTFTTIDVVTGADTEDFGTSGTDYNNGAGSWSVASTGSFGWFNNSGTTVSTSTGPANGGTDGTSTDYYLYTEASGTSGTAILYSPYYDISSMSDPRLAFDYHMYGADMGTLTVYVMKSDGTETALSDATFTGQQQSSNTAPWVTANASLSAFTDQSLIRFKITHTHGGNFNGDAAIDDFGVEETPSCVAPTGLTVTNTTATTATYSWTGDSTNTDYSYTTIDSTGANVASASGTTTSGAATVNVTGLSGNTTYTVTVTGICGSNTSSSVQTSFTTPCSAYSIPFSEGFETGYTSGSNIGTTGGNGNVCYTEEQVGTSAYYAYAYNGTVGTLVTPNSGSWSGFVGTSATNIWYFFDVALTGGVSYTAGVYARASVATTSVTEKSIAISYGSSASAADMTTQIVAPSVLGTSYQQTTGEFTPLSDGTYTIGINFIHDGTSGGYLNFDDISIVETPSCVAPSGLTVTNTTATTATYSWTADSTNTDYSYTTTDSTGATVASASGTSTSGAVTVNVTGLSGNTTYTVTVTGICGSDTSSSITTSFTTPCVVATTGFSQNFNGLTSMPSCWAVTNGGDSNTWGYSSSYSLGGNTFSGGVAIYYNSSAHDDYLYSPVFTVTDGVTDGFSFNAQSGLSSYPEPLDISVVNTNTGETTLIYDDYEVGVYEYAFHSEFYDLSAFEGQDIKIAFHSTTTDMNYILLDNFVVGSASSMATGWAGFTSSVYSNAQNWYAGVVPTADVTLNVNSDSASNSPAIGSAVTASSLTVGSSATLTVSEAGSIQTSGNFTNNGTVTFNSTATAYPSMIVGGTATGNITYNRYAAVDRWYGISSPVSGQDIDTFISNEDLLVSTNNPSLVALADYNNDGTQYTTDPSITTGWWQYHQSAQSTSGNFTVGKGKIVRLASDATDNLLSFTGGINNGTLTVPITTNTTAFNLVGNPYAASIAVNSVADATNNVLTVNSALLSEQTAWFWDGSSSAYVAVNQNPSQAAKFAPPGQGFFISSATGGGNLSFTNAMQTISTTATFNRQTEFSKIDLSMSADGQTSATEIVYFEGATTGWDNGYDSTNFSSAAFQLFTDHVDNAWDDNLSIQSLPPNNYDNMVVPVGVYASAGQSIAISIGTTNWPEGVNVYLEDTDDNSFTLLTANTAFTTLLDSDENGIGRFYIHTTSNSLGDEDLTLTDVVIYTPSKDILRILGLSSGPANVQMFDLMGKQVLNTSFNGQSVNDVKLPNLNTGVYLVTLVSDEGTVNKKLMIQ
jgi:hypothetical protein